MIKRLFDIRCYVRFCGDCGRLHDSVIIVNPEVLHKLVDAVPTKEFFFFIQRDVTYEEAKQFADENGKYL